MTYAQQNVMVTATAHVPPILWRSIE